jgi:hypothetical protein
MKLVEVEKEKCKFNPKPFVGTFITEAIRGSGCHPEKLREAPANETVHDI